MIARKKMYAETTLNPRACHDHNESSQRKHTSKVTMKSSQHQNTCNTHDHLKKPSGSGCPCTSFYIFQHMLIPTRFDLNLTSWMANPINWPKCKPVTIILVMQLPTAWYTAPANSRLKTNNSWFHCFSKGAQPQSMLKNSQRGTFQETIKSGVNSFPRLRELETIKSRFNYVTR